MTVFELATFIDDLEVGLSSQTITTEEAARTLQSLNLNNVIAEDERQENFKGILQTRISSILNK